MTRTTEINSKLAQYFGLQHKPQKEDELERRKKMKNERNCGARSLGIRNECLVSPTELITEGMNFASVKRSRLDSSAKQICRRFARLAFVRGNHWELRVWAESVRSKAARGRCTDKEDLREKLREIT